MSVRFTDTSKKNSRIDGLYTKCCTRTYAAGHRVVKIFGGGKNSGERFF